MIFFERFRSALKQYADGVHALAPPAAPRPLPDGIPPAYREFLAQWDGGWLFHDDYRLRGAAELLAAGEVEFGAAPAGPLRFDARGRVVAVDEETGARAVCGSDFQRWLDAVMAREAVLYDRQGEFREGALDGVDLSARAARKRAEAAVRADPDAPAWREELGRLLAAEGKATLAARELARAVELDPSAASAWFELAKQRRAAADPAGAAEAYARAAEAEREPEEAAFSFAHAARAAREAGLSGAAALGARAAAAFPGFVADQRAAAAHLADEGDLDGAVERLELAAAAAPGDGEIAREVSHARARRALRPG